MTDIIYIDASKDKVVKRIELVDVIQDEERKETKCRFDLNEAFYYVLHLIISRSIAYHSSKIFVGDMGKNRMFVLDDTMDVEIVGETGNGRLQFKVSRILTDLLCCCFYKQTLAGAKLPCSR